MVNEVMRLFNQDEKTESLNTSASLKEKYQASSFEDLNSSFKRTAFLEDLVKDAERVFEIDSFRSRELLREKIALSINKRYQQNYTLDDFRLCGGSIDPLKLALQALANPYDEYIIIRPFRAHYADMIKSVGGVPVSVDSEKDFSLDVAAIEQSITSQTRGIIISLPNDPTGRIYSEDEINELTGMLKEKEAFFDHPIYLFVDYAYLDFASEKIKIAWLPQYYEDSIICYSSCCSTSLVGESFGYVFVNPASKENGLIHSALSGVFAVTKTQINGFFLQRLMYEKEWDSFDLFEERHEKILKELFNNVEVVSFSYASPFVWIKKPNENQEAFLNLVENEHLEVISSECFGVEDFLRVNISANQ